MTTKEEVMTLTDHLRKKALKETLKYAAGRKMFCQGCQKVLDWKTTVVLTAKKGEASTMVIMCDKCFQPAGVGQLEAKGYVIEVDKWK